MLDGKLPPLGGELFPARHHSEDLIMDDLNSLLLQEEIDSKHDFFVALYVSNFRVFIRSRS